MKIAGHFHVWSLRIAMFRSSTGSAPLECQKSPKKMIPAFLHCPIDWSDNIVLQPSLLIYSILWRQKEQGRKRLKTKSPANGWVIFYHTLQQLLRTLFEELPCICHMCAGSDEGPKKPPRFQLQPTHPYPHPAKQNANTNSHFVTCCLGFRVTGDNQALETRFFTHPPKHWVSKTTTEELGFPYLAKSKDPPPPMFQRGSLPMSLLL